MSNPKDIVKQIRKSTRRRFSPDEKIRIVLEGLRGDIPITEICRREGIAASVYYKWSKEFLEAGKNGLTRSSIRNATSDEVKQLTPEEDQTIVEIALLNPEWSSRELSLYITDNKGFSVSESTVYKEVKGTRSSSRTQNSEIPCLR